MKRVIFDTNIYGIVLEQEEPEKFKETIGKSSIIIYGVATVRKELRNVPKKSVVFNRSVGAVRNLRNSLLALYDSVTKKEYDVSRKTELLAYDYYIAYRESGGSESWDGIKNDFIIVACASIHSLDVVVSDDKRTMLSGEAMIAYRIVNKIKRLRMPEFLGYEGFRRLLP